MISIYSYKSLKIPLLFQNTPKDFFFLFLRSSLIIERGQEAHGRHALLHARAWHEWVQREGPRPLGVVVGLVLLLMVE